MKSVFTLSALLATLVVSNPSFAALEITCDVPEQSLQVIVRHPLNPSNLDPNQALSTYEVQRTSDGQVLGTGDIPLSQFVYDSWLNTLVFAFSDHNENIAIGVGLEDSNATSLETLKTGRYNAKSDLFLAFTDEIDGYASGTTLDCVVDYSN